MQYNKLLYICIGYLIVTGESYTVGFCFLKIFQAAQIQDKYDTQNVGIGNQQNEYNNASYNKVRAAKVTYNQNYIDKVNYTLGKSNEEKIKTGTDLLNKGLGYYAQNLAMKNQLNTM